MNMIYPDDLEAEHDLVEVGERSACIVELEDWSDAEQDQDWPDDDD